jgi:NAD(P)-dependent dehydrogenase (short-subunit alcohol dehydrogenase family)
MAMGFAEAGADLFLTDNNSEGVQETAHHIESMGRRAVAGTFDVTDVDQIGQMFRLLDQEYGRIDALGNVFGPGYVGHPEVVPLVEVDRVLHGLVTARLGCCQEAGRRMLQAGKGSIINIGSLVSVSAVGRAHITYSMGMGAIAQMTRELSTEWAGRGVRVNAILSAQVMNPGLEERMKAEPDLEARFLRAIPAGRLGVPDDIKGVAIFLASDASAWTTGALIPMDGGNLAINASGTVGPRG